RRGSTKRASPKARHGSSAARPGWKANPPNRRTAPSGSDSCEKSAVARVRIAAKRSTPVAVSVVAASKPTSSLVVVAKKLEAPSGASASRRAPGPTGAGSANAWSSACARRSRVASNASARSRGVEALAFEGNAGELMRTFGSCPSGGPHVQVTHTERERAHFERRHARGAHQLRELLRGRKRRDR